MLPVAQSVTKTSLGLGDGTHLTFFSKRLSGGLEKDDIKDLKLFLQNTSAVYACFLLAVVTVYYALGGSFMNARGADQLRYASVVAEALGLLVLRRKIERQGRVTGVSGMTFTMYALVYTLRLVAFAPESADVDDWSLEVLAFGSLLLVLDVCRMVFVNHKKTYQEELDVLKVKYLAPACVLLGVLIHPDLRSGVWFNCCWTVCLYLDVVALMPQVVMMSMGGGKVEAPIGHFVAATALSRSVDLWYWFYMFDSVGPEDTPPGSFHYSAWLIVLAHMLHLLLVADFMYYYMKGRVQGMLSAEGCSSTVDV